MINSRFLDGMTIEQAKEEVAKRLETETRGNRPVAQRQVNFRLRDWGISRQRYWGCPIPIIHCETCGIVPVPKKDLPVKLPDDVTFDRPGNPLDRHPTWKNVACPTCGERGAARNRHHGHLRRLVLVFRALHRSVDRRRTRPIATSSIAGCRSINISAASSTRSCICSTAASSLRAMKKTGRTGTRRTVRRPVHAGHGGSRDLSQAGRRVRAAVRGHDRGGGRPAQRHAHRDRRADRDRPHREDVEVEAEHRRPRRHHRQLRRRHRALVRAVGFAARARRDLDRGRRAGLVALRAAAVAAGRRDRRRSRRRRRPSGRPPSASPRWRFARPRIARWPRSPRISTSCASTAASRISTNSPTRSVRRSADVTSPADTDPGFRLGDARGRRHPGPAIRTR